MSLSERLLLLASRKPGTRDFPSVSNWSQNDPLSILCRVFPGFLDRVPGKDVLDVGCGDGDQVVALARRGARRVVGVETQPDRLCRARTLAVREGVADKVELVSRIGDEHAGSFDVVICQNSMEHFPDPAAELAAMARALKSGGTLFVTFGPPWLAPYGSHMYFFTRLPWVNLLFSERTVLRVRARFRDDGATRYEELTEGLNRMTVGRFERLAAGCGLDIMHRRYECSRGLDLLGRVPLVRELFINQVTCELVKR